MRNRSRNHGSSKLLLPMLAAGMLSGCWRSPPQAQPLTIDRTSPALGNPRSPVLLNDALTVYFSDEIMPLSVTPDSVALLDESGHQVQGVLHAEANWVTFQPLPPLSPDLSDGTFRPGGEYRLMLAGGFRPDSIRARDGRWLDAATAFRVYVANLDQAPPGLPSVLRPPAGEVLFTLAPSEAAQLPADAPLLRLHFTLPLLPSSVSAEAFDVRLLDTALVALRPRSVRVVTSPVDKYPGSTVEIDLGSMPQREDGQQRPLSEWDSISVEVRSDAGLSDYAGNSPLPSTPLLWSVVPGRSLPLCEWPADELCYVGEDDVLPGFEVHGSSIRPRVRVEAGNGSLGVFRPRRDVTLRPGHPFESSDGHMVVSDGADFPFLAIDIPADVTVTLDARAGPARLLACGGIRIGGQLRIVGPAVSVPAGRFVNQPVSELATMSPVTLLAAGDIDIRGAISTDTEIGESETALLLATASRLLLHGPLPFQTVLVTETRDGVSASRFEGSRGQSLNYPGSFEYGLAPGADFTVRGVLPWRQLPPHQDRGTVQLVDVRGDLSVAWQSTSADAVRPGQPDLVKERMGRWQLARDGEALAIGSGAFVRFELSCRVQHGSPLPRLREVRVIEN